MTTAQLLNKALKRTQKSNPQFSIRAIARISGLSSSYVSKVMRGLRWPSEENLKKIATCLQMDHHETQELIAQAGLVPKRRKSRLVEKKASAIVENFKTFSQKEYWLLERWYYFPLLALASTKKSFRASAEAAKILGLNAGIAHNAVQNLVAAGYLIQKKNGVFTPTELQARFPTQRSHASVRTHNKEMITRALKLLESSPAQRDYEERLISGVTFAGNPEFIQEAKVAIEEGIFKAAQILARGPSSEVFQLNIQLYKHSKS